MCLKYKEAMDRDSLATSSVESRELVDDVEVQPENTVREFNFNTSMLGKGYLSRRKSQLRPHRHLSVQDEDPAALSDDGYRSRYPSSSQGVEGDENATDLCRTHLVDNQMDPYPSSQEEKSPPLDGARGISLGGSAGGSVYVPGRRDTRSSMFNKRSSDYCLPMDGGFSTENSDRPMEMDRYLGEPTYTPVHGPGDSNSSWSTHMSSDHWLPMDDVFSPEESARPIGMERYLGGPTYTTVHGPGNPRKSWSSQMSSDHWLPMDDVFSPEESARPTGRDRSLGGQTYTTLHGPRDPRNSWYNQMSSDHWLPKDEGFSPEDSARPTGGDRSLGGQTYTTLHGPRDPRNSWHSKMSSDTYPNGQNCRAAMGGSFGGSILASSRNFIDKLDWNHHAEGISSPEELSTWSPWKCTTTQGNSNAKPVSIVQDQSQDREVSGEDDDYDSYARGNSNAKPVSIVQDESQDREVSGEDVDYDSYAMGNLSKTADGSRLCPMPGCDRKVQKWAKHLEQYHRLGKEGSRLYINRLKVKDREQSRPRSQSGRLAERYQQCPVCGLSYTRVNDHIKKKHKKKERYSGGADGESVQRQPNSERSVLARGQRDVVDKEPDATGEEMHVAAETDNEAVVRRRVLEEGGGGWAQEQSDNVGQEWDESDINHALTNAQMRNEEGNTLHEAENMDSGDKSKHTYKVNKEVRFLLEKFGQWAASPSGTSLSQRTVNTYVPACGRCIEYLGGTLESIQKYAEIGSPTGYMVEKSKLEKARTTRVTVYAMLKLMEYLKMNRNTVFTNRDAASLAYDTVKNFAVSLRSDVQYEKEERKIFCQEKVEELKPIMANYDSTEHYRNTKDLFTKASTKSTVSNDEFLDMRAYLITELLRKNGHRTGVITNCLLSRFRKARQVGNTYQIDVNKHKTGRGGVAILTMPEDLWKELKVYVSVLPRAVQCGENDSYVFATRNGTSMESNGVIGAVKRALNLKTTVNHIRQMHVVIASEQKATPQEMDSMSKLMCHSTRVQKEYYDVSNRQLNAAQVSKEMGDRLKKYKACI